jgi:ABC-type Fe3+-siderophore transport system permease subunit
MPPYASGEPIDQPGGNGIAVAALVLGLASIPTAFTVYLGAICGVLGIVFGVLGLLRARRRQGRGRAMALAGLAAAVIGLVLSVVLFGYTAKRLQECRNELGPNATRSQLQQCVRDKLGR